jgi:hypothetical protein
MAAAAALVVAAPTPSSLAAPITYKTLFQDPGEDPVADLSLEQHAISLVDATPAGEHIAFAFRDFNRRPVADALIAAAARGVIVDGVIDGDERGRAVVGLLQGALGPEHFVICGSPTFEFNSCIAHSERPSLQHNKFLVLSRLSDGREHVVLQTSMNFLAPSQLTYYNDMVEISGDAALHAAYVDFVSAMKAQVRSDDHFLVASGDDGRNTMYPSPRRQPDRDTDDIIVDRLDEVDCSVGGSAGGRGLVRIANMAFRSERAVIMRKLVALERDGCEIDVVVSNADGDIMAGLASAGIRVRPFFRRALGTRPQVIVHDKFWLVDARSTLTGRRTRIAYAGSSNWRGDQQRSDDLLLRIVDDGVHAAYTAYWQKIAARAVSDLPRPLTDLVAPAAAIGARPAAGAARWNRSDVRLRVAGSDGHLPTASGLARLRVETSGAQTDSRDLAGEVDGHNVGELVISAEGTTEVTAVSEDVAGNVGEPAVATVRVDRTRPALAGVPSRCVLRPANRRLVHVADIGATDGLSGVADLSISARSTAPDDETDIVIRGGSVDLRAERAPGGRSRTYVVRVTARDLAGNRARATITCHVPAAPA